MIRLIKGDILNAFDRGCNAICHQVNCQGVMGAGLAKDISDKWPEVKADYLEFCKREMSENLLGTYLAPPVDEDRYVVDIFGQLNYGRDRDRVYTNYSALDSAFEKLSHDDKFDRIAFPYGFGCGLGGGDWSRVLHMMIERMSNKEIDIYIKGEK